MDPTGWDAPSTRRAAEYLRQAPDGLAVKLLLVVVADADSVEARSFRNLPNVAVLEAPDVETVDLVAAGALLVERAAWERIAGAIADVEAVSGTPKPAVTKQAPPAPKLAATEAGAPDAAAETAPDDEDGAEAVEPPEVVAEADEPAETAAPAAAGESTEEPIADQASDDEGEAKA